MSGRWTELRVRRLRNRISRGEMARRLECSGSWLDRLESNCYRGPCSAAWYDRYRVALDELVDEKRQAKVG